MRKLDIKDLNRVSGGQAPAPKEPGKTNPVRKDGSGNHSSSSGSGRAGPKPPHKPAPPPAPTPAPTPPPQV